MDERTWFFLYLLLSMGFFALLGGAFGAVVGYTTWRSGRAAGTALGLAVVRAFSRLGEEPMAPTRQGALAGCVDGLAFGLLVGGIVGVAIGWHGGEWRLLAPIVLTGLFLAGGAIVFGSMALVIAAGKSRSIVGLFVGGAIGAVSGYVAGQLDGLFVGVLVGAGTGAVVGWPVRR